MNNELIDKMENARKVLYQISVYNYEIERLEYEKKSIKRPELLTDKMIICSVLLAIVTFGISLIVIIPYLIYRTKKQKTSEKDYINRLSEINERSNALKSELSEYYGQHINELNFIPIEYCFDMALEYMIKILQSERAQTLPECLDKLDEQIHRWRMEASSAQMLQNQMLQNSRLENIQKSSVEAAKAAKVSAAANVYTAAKVRGISKRL